MKVKYKNIIVIFIIFLKYPKICGGNGGSVIEGIIIPFCIILFFLAKYRFALLVKDGLEIGLWLEHLEV